MKKQKKQHKNLRKGDKVIVIAGNDKGQIGTILNRTDKKAIVQGINVRKKHMKKTQENPQGGIVELERPIQLSNVMACTPDDKPIKLKRKFDKDGDKILYHKDGTKETTFRKVKK